MKKIPSIEGRCQAMKNEYTSELLKYETQLNKLHTFYGHATCILSFSHRWLLSLWNVDNTNEIWICCSIEASML